MLQLPPAELFVFDGILLQAKIYTYGIIVQRGKKNNSCKSVACQQTDNHFFFLVGYKGGGVGLNYSIVLNFIVFYFRQLIENFLVFVHFSSD